MLPGVIDLVTEPETMRRATEEERCEVEVGGLAIGRRWRGLWDLDMISWPRHAVFGKADSSTSIESVAAVCSDFQSD